MVDRICDNCMNRVPANAEQCSKCGIRFENTNPGGALPNGWVLGSRYTVGRYIDIDGEGVTYSAIDGNSFQLVIIKEFMPVTLCANRNERGAIVAKPGNEVLFKTTRMDFIELYSNLVRMNHAEGLVSVLDLMEENNTAYAVLEKVEGSTLSEYLARQNRPMEANRALAIMRPIMLGVEALHASNVVHRGISPDNIILESGGTAKLGGYATLALRQQGTELKPKLYSGFSAPEQYSASEFEGRYTDVYAIGALLYRITTGETPVSADERKVQDHLRPARVLDKEIPTFLSSGISRAMRVNSEERIQTIADLRMAFSGEGGRNAGSPPQKSSSATHASSSSAAEGDGLFGLTRTQTIIGGVALGVVLLLLLIIILVFALSGSGGKGASSSLEAVSSSQSQVSDIRVPDFKGKKYKDVMDSKQYTDVYIFADPVEQYSKDVEEGKIISQTPEAGAEWDGKTPIQFVISKGYEPVKMPDFTSEVTTRAEAELELTKLEITYEIVKKTNNGTYKNDQVIETTPAAGTMVVPKKDKVIVYVAGDATTTPMPNVVGKTQADAVTELKAKGVSENQIKIEVVANDGAFAAGKVASSDPAAGASISVGSVIVTLKVYDKATVPSFDAFVGKASGELIAWLDARKANYVYTTVTVTNDGTHAEGTVQKVDAPPVNSEAKPGTVITIYVYGKPPDPVVVSPAA